MYHDLHNIIRWVMERRCGASKVRQGPSSFVALLSSASVILLVLPIGQRNVGWARDSHSLLLNYFCSVRLFIVSLKFNKLWPSCSFTYNTATHWHLGTCCIYYTPTPSSSRSWLEENNNQSVLCLTHKASHGRTCTYHISYRYCSCTNCCSCYFSMFIRAAARWLRLGCCCSRLWCR